NGTGAVMSPFDCYLVLRGTKTLPARMRMHESNATAIAEFLEDHPAVEGVNYPGLESHPQHDLAADQMHGYGGMLSFDIDGGFDAAARFLESLEEINLAVSLGGVESLIAHTPTMTHYYLDEPTRQTMGITDSLIRLSTGIEHEADLIADLEQGLDRI
ncbi:MAG: PLP-dependent transferase, partial [Halobacteriales archaeon]|nr:PLP-dependent transferase [Halobacteriales archaeon]